MRPPRTSHLVDRGGGAVRGGWGHRRLSSTSGGVIVVVCVCAAVDSLSRPRRCGAGFKGGFTYIFPPKRENQWRTSPSWRPGLRGSLRDRTARQQDAKTSETQSRTLRRKFHGNRNRKINSWPPRAVDQDTRHRRLGPSGTYTSWLELEAVGDFLVTAALDSAAISLMGFSSISSSDAPSSFATTCPSSSQSLTISQSIVK